MDTLRIEPPGIETYVPVADIRDRAGNLVCDVATMTDAELIVHRVNTYPALVAALEAMAEAVNTLLDNWPYWTDEQKQKHLQDMQVSMMRAARTQGAGQKGGQ